MSGFFLSNWFHYFYAPTNGPWYAGNVWGNVFVVFVAFPLGYVWSKTKFWPLRPMQKGFKSVEEHFVRIHQHHAKQNEHNEWMAKHTAEMYEKHMGKEAEQHPHFSHIGKQDSKDAPTHKV